MLDWNDLRYFLAVARERQHAGRRPRSCASARPRLRAASPALGGGARLPDLRKAAGRLRRLRPRGRAARDVPRQVETQPRMPLRRIGRGLTCPRAERHRAHHYGGNLCADLICARCCADLHERHPEILIELDTSQEVRDLGAGEADIALRSSSKEPINQRARRPSALRRRLGALLQPRLCRAARCPADPAGTLSSTPIVGGGGGNLWRHYQSWLQSLGLEQQVAMHHAHVRQACCRPSAQGSASPSCRASSPMRTRT